MGDITLNIAISLLVRSFENTHSKLTFRCSTVPPFPQFHNIQWHRFNTFDQWVFVLDHRVFALDQRVFVLDQWVFVLDHRVFVLDLKLKSLRRGRVFGEAVDFTDRLFFSLVIYSPIFLFSLHVSLRKLCLYEKWRSASRACVR